MTVYEEHHGEAAAYLLGALSELEESAFERHLMRCEECANDLERLGVAVDALPRSVAPVEPSAGLRESLMETVRREAPASSPAPQSRARRSWSLLPRLGPGLAWVGAAFLLGVGVTAGYGSLASDDRAAPAPRSLSARFDRSRVRAGNATLTLPPGGGGAVLRVEDVEQPPDGRVYQLWLLRGRQPVPAGLLAVEADGTGSTTVDGNVSGAQAVLVTRERAGGAVAPSEIPLVRIPLA